MLADWPDRDMVDIIRLLILTGARTGEVRKAEWSQFHDLNGDTPRWVKPSSHTKQKRKHTVPLSKQAVAVLHEVAERSGKSAFLFPHPTAADGVVPWRAKQWRQMLKDADIKYVKPYVTRHSYASLLASEGLPTEVIGKLLGHTQARTTARYAKIADDPLREATEGLGDMIGTS